MDWYTALPGTTICQSTYQLSIMEPMYINAGFLFHARQEHPKRKRAIGGPERENIASQKKCSVEWQRYN